MIERKQKLKKAVASAVLLCFTSLTGAQPLYAVPANTQLPDIAQAGAGVEISKPDNTVMNIHQEGQTAVNQWNNFSIGADATVNFTGPAKGFNSFNYVKNGPISEIYGQLNALGGNIPGRSTDRQLRTDKRRKPVRDDARTERRTPTHNRQA